MLKKLQIEVKLRSQDTYYKYLDFFYITYYDIYDKNKRMYIDMLQTIGILIGAIIVLLGIIMIYDARILTKKFFGFGDQNEASSGLKILGFIIAIVGGLIIYFVK